MTKSILKACLPTVVLAALLVSACQTSATAPADRHVSQSDLDFVTGLTNLREFDHEVIGEELHRSSDPRVHALAQELLNNVDAFYAKVEPISTRDGIEPPKDQSLFRQSDMHSRVATLMATGTYDFDAEFLSDELDGNRQILDQAEGVVREPSGDPELRALIEDALVRLRSNVARLEDLQKQLKG